MSILIYALIILYCIIYFAACRKKPIAGIYQLSFDKDLIPEGIAIDPATHKVYLNSLKNNKIVRSNLEGSEKRLLSTPTFSIIDDHVGFVMNTQLENFDDTNNEIKEPDSLRAYMLMLHPLD